MKRDPRHLVVILENIGTKRKEIRRSLTQAYQRDFGLLSCNTENMIRDRCLYDSERNLFI